MNFKFMIYINPNLTMHHHVSISSTFYKQLLHTQIPKLKSAKNTVKLSVFFALLGSALVKAERKMLKKSTPR